MPLTRFELERKFWDEYTRLAGKKVKVSKVWRVDGGNYTPVMLRPPAEVFLAERPQGFYMADLAIENDGWLTGFWGISRTADERLAEGPFVVILPSYKLDGTARDPGGLYTPGRDDVEPGFVEGRRQIELDGLGCACPKGGGLGGLGCCGNCNSSLGSYGGGRVRLWEFR